MGPPIPSYQSDHVTFSPGDGFAKKQVETEDPDSKEVDIIRKILASVDNVASRWDHWMKN